MKLYMHPVSTTSRSVRLFCAENGIAIDEEMIDLMTGAQHKEPYVSLNPNWQVPLLEDGDLRLSESSAIQLMGYTLIAIRGSSSQRNHY